MDIQRIWAVRAGNQPEIDQVFLELGQLAMSFPQVSDASLLPASRDALKEAFARTPHGTKPQSIPAQAGQLFRFIHEMRIGDRVIYPRKSDRSLRWGEITGPYLFLGDVSGDHAHRRSVRWLAKAGRDSFSQGALYELGSILTLFEVKSYAEEFIAKFEGGGEQAAVPDAALADETEQSVVRDIVETTKDFISKRLKAEFKGYQLEPFVAELFRAMGYRANTTRKSKDDGVDVIAHRDELGIEPPILKIQVKSGEGPIGSDVVKAFYAVVHERDVGIFITVGGYTVAAAEFARTRGNLKLINGIEFVDLIQKYYDRLDINFRKQIPLRRILVPDVALDDD